MNHCSYWQGEVIVCTVNKSFLLKCANNTKCIPTLSVYDDYSYSLTDRYDMSGGSLVDRART